MSDNVVLTTSAIAREALRRLENSLVFARLCHRAHESEFTTPVNGIKKGDTITIRKPVKYTYRTGNVAQTQNSIQGSTSIKIDQEGGVDLEFAQKDLTLKVTDFGETYLKGAMSTIANQIDMKLFELAKQVPNWVGTPGEIINSFGDFLKGPERMTELAVPGVDRRGILSPADYTGMAANFSQLFARQGNTAEDALRQLKLGVVGNVDTYEAQNVLTLVTGTRDNTTPLVNGAAQVRTYGAGLNEGGVAGDHVDGVGTSDDLVKDFDKQTLVTDGWDASVTIKAGEVFTIAGVYAVNPVSRTALPFLRQFVVMADATASGGGAATLTIRPAIITSGAYATVDAAPADDAAVVMMGSASTSYRQNVMFHKDAFALCMVPMELPQAVKDAARESYEGLSVNITPYYDGVNNRSKWRLDVLFGVKSIYPELATRVSGTA